MVAEQLGAGWVAERARVEPIIDREGTMLFFYTMRKGAEPRDFEVRIPKEPDLEIVHCYISPREAGHLTVQQHNSVLEALWEEHLGPACEKASARAALTSAERQVQQMIPAELAKYLKGYLDSANWGDSGRHPADEKRWMQFIIMLLDYDLAGDELAELLSEDYRVPEKWARRLARELDFGRGLLNLYRGGSTN